MYEGCRHGGGIGVEEGSHGRQSELSELGMGRDRNGPRKEGTEETSHKELKE